MKEEEGLECSEERVYSITVHCKIKMYNHAVTIQTKKQGHACGCDGSYCKIPTFGSIIMMPGASLKPSGRDCIPSIRGTGLSKYACKEEGRVTITGPAHFKGRNRLTRASTQPDTTPRSVPTTTTLISVSAQPTARMI